MQYKIRDTRQVWIAGVAAAMWMFLLLTEGWQAWFFFPVLMLGIIVVVEIIKYHDRRDDGKK